MRRNLPIGMGAGLTKPMPYLPSVALSQTSHIAVSFCPSHARTIAAPTSWYEFDSLVKRLPLASTPMMPGL
ncbi:hypothetical protein Y695_04708 [Hydrogenophaga sp. T4]|nr:hypothetical protein Y695_04708 [Hydrogenophaga sp. T4]